VSLCFLHRVFFFLPPSFSWYTTVPCLGSVSAPAPSHEGEEQESLCRAARHCTLCRSAYAVHNKKHQRCHGGLAPLPSLSGHTCLVRIITHNHHTSANKKRYRCSVFVCFLFVAAGARSFLLLSLLLSSTLPHYRVPLSLSSVVLAAWHGAGHPERTSSIHNNYKKESKSTLLYHVSLSLSACVCLRA
jgi:hypothetical protein